MDIEKDRKGEVHQLPVAGTSHREPPKRIVRPCEYGLMNAVHSMETQMGTVDAYNKLCDAAAHLKAKIDAGDARASHPMWATDPNYIYPLGHAPKGTK
jgi:hypothetical protein